MVATNYAIIKIDGITIMYFLIKIWQWLLPLYCATKRTIGCFHQINQDSGFQTVAATLEILFPQTNYHQCNNNADQSQQMTLLPQYCVNKIHFCSNIYHITVAISYFSVRVHMQVIAATVLCQ